MFEVQICNIQQANLKAENKQGEEYMNRNNILKNLQSISFCAVPTVSTMDMGLEFDYVTPKGAGTGLGAFGEWPAHEFRPIKSEQWTSIITKIKRGELTIEDLAGTDLKAFVNDIKEYHEEQITALCETLSCLADIKVTPENNLFCLYDRGAWEDTPRFFTDFDDLKEAFYNSYCMDCTPWEGMTDDDLEYWFNRLSYEFNTFPLNSYDDCIGN